MICLLTNRPKEQLYLRAMAAALKLTADICNMQLDATGRDKHGHVEGINAHTQ